MIFFPETVMSLQDLQPLPHPLIRPSRLLQEHFVVLPRPKGTRQVCVRPSPRQRVSISAGSQTRVHARSPLAHSLQPLLPLFQCHSLLKTFPLPRPTRNSSLPLRHPTSRGGAVFTPMGAPAHTPSYRRTAPSHRHPHPRPLTPADTPAFIRGTSLCFSRGRARFRTAPLPRTVRRSWS